MWKISLRVSALLAVIVVVYANYGCTFSDYQDPTDAKSAERANTDRATVTGDTILDVNYESGTTNSGITDVDPTNATASDAVGVISPGRNGTYGIMHKVTLGQVGYYSNEANRMHRT